MKQIFFLQDLKVDSFISLMRSVLVYIFLFYINNYLFLFGTNIPSHSGINLNTVVICSSLFTK